MLTGCNCSLTDGASDCQKHWLVPLCCKVLPQRNRSDPSCAAAHYKCSRHRCSAWHRGSELGHLLLNYLGWHITPQWKMNKRSVIDPGIILYLLCPPAGVRSVAARAGTRAREWAKRRRKLAAVWALQTVHVLAILIFQDSSSRATNIFNLGTLWNCKWLERFKAQQSASDRSRCHATWSQVVMPYSC